MTLFRGLPALLILLTIASPARSAEPEVAGKSAPEWAEILRESPNVRLRLGAAVALGLIGSKSKVSMPALTRALRDESEELVRQKIVTSLGQLRENEPIPIIDALAEAVKADKSPSVRSMAATALGRFNDEAEPALVVLSGALKDTDPATRAAVAEAIGRIGEGASEAAPRLVPLLEDDHPNVRLWAAFALGRINPDVDVAGPGLAMSLRTDEAVEVRRAAARSLGLIRAADQAGPMADALTADTSVEVRRAVVLALTRIGPRAAHAADALMTALRDDEDKSVRTFAAHALVVCLGDNAEQAVPTLAAQLGKEPVGEVRLVIVGELGALGPKAKEAIPALTAAQRDVQRAVRTAATTALKRITADPTAPPSEEPENQP